jgi:hypothetical protein
LRGANLRGANLYGANLCGADLRGANLRGEILAINPLFIQGLTYLVCITEGFLEIGCQRHTHEEWSKFDSYHIESMDRKATPFWTSNRDWLLAACVSHKEAALAYRKQHGES